MNLGGCVALGFKLLLGSVWILGIEFHTNIVECGIYLYIPTGHMQEILMYRTYVIGKRVKSAL